MDNKILIGFILGAIFDWFNNLSVEPIRKKWRRQCNYDCFKCKVWDCDRFYCLAQKEKENRKREKKEREKYYETDEKEK